MGMKHTSWEDLFSMPQGQAKMDMEMRLVQPRRRKRKKPASKQKKQAPKLAPKLQRAVELLAAGMTPREVAKELGVYDSQIRKWMNHPDFEANMEAQGMKYSRKTGWQAKKNPTPQWLPLSSIQPVVAEMEAQGVSEVARSKRGFLNAYKRARGDVRKLGRDPAFGQDWVKRRNNFVARHMAQIRNRKEPLWVDGSPSRRHLALIAWAYSPTAEKLKKYVQAKKNPKPGSKADDRDQGQPALPHERIRGSSVNKPGSATAKGSGSIKLSEKTEKALRRKVEDHNAKYGDTPSKRVTYRMLAAVYRRGSGAFSKSHRPGMKRAQWAFARVNHFLKIVQRGYPDDSKYIQDNDLLPKSHKRSTRENPQSKPTYIRRPPSQAKAKSMRKNPKIKSVGLPLSKGEGVTDSPQQWRKGLVKFQRLVEGLGEDLPTGVWVVAMGFPTFELVESVVRHGRTGGVVKPPLNQYKHSWAALYKDAYTGVWVVEAINYTGYPAGGEASLFPLRLLKPSSNAPQLWEDLDQATTAYGVETPFELEEEQDMVDSVKPVLSWASKIIDAPWETPIFRTLTSPQERLVQEFDRAQRGKKNPREKNTIAYLEKRMRELEAERRRLRPGSAEWKEVREEERRTLKKLRKAWKHTPQSIRFPKRNPRGSDIYDPREEQLRAQRQAIYETSLLRDEPQLKFKSFRNSKGERLDQIITEEGDLPWLRKYIGKKMFQIGVGVQKRDLGVRRKDGYLVPTNSTITKSQSRYSDVDKLVRNRQDYEESLALMRKSSFYRVTKEPTRDGWMYFVWPLQPGQRIPKGFKNKKRAENVVNLANRDAPTVGGAWWKPPKKKYTKRELGHWLPPASVWRR